MMRPIRIRMPDETIRSVMVPESQPVANLMVIICTKLGITNHDEYSLIATGKHTINGRRKERQDGRIIDQKMEQLKKKLKTDEDLAWVDHSKTLDEQEIHEQDVVLLRRRFFYSDQNIDTRDPLQLGLLYVQTRDAILSGTHPVTLDGACKFAAIEAQAQLGDFMEGKTTRPGYMNIKDYLPADYAKQKHIERKIFNEHKKYYGLSELEAKAKYISEARSLPTYGVTFFLVKEKVPGKNKLVPRLLGVTKDCVMRVDADTKGILKTWPLTTVKRWAASMNSFTLDFGDYSDSYYSVQTSEGEQISQLIAGYIDIILKRRKAKDHFGIEGDEGATMIEDSVAPSRATIIQNQPALARPPSAAPSQIDLTSVAGPTVEKVLHEEGPHVEPPEVRPAMEIRGKAEMGYEARPVTQYATNYELSLPQRDLQDRLEQAQDAVEAAQKVLDRPMPQGERERLRVDSNEVEHKKKRLSSQFADINAATAQLVSLSAIPEEELNYTDLNQAVDTVTTSLPSVAKDVKIVASMMEDDETGEHLIDAARRLCKAFSDLLNAAEPKPTVPRQTLISAASRVGDATQALLQTINSDQDEDEDEGERESADVLLSLAKSVASSAAALVLKAKDVGSTCSSKELSDQVIGSATQCALATSQMVATAKIVTPTIQDPQCQHKLLDACRGVQQAVDGIQQTCQRVLRDDELLCSVEDAVRRVNQALDELMDHVQSVKHRRHQVTKTRHHKQNTQRNTSTTTSQQQYTTVHRIVDETSGRPVASLEDVSQSSSNNNNNKNELINQARNLAQATTQLIHDIRPENGGQATTSSSTLGRNGRQSYSNQGPRSNQYYNTYSAVNSHRNYVDERPDEPRHNQRQQQQQQQQQHQTQTETITTTIYDEQYQRSGGGDARPVSMYDSEQSVNYHDTNRDIATTTTTTEQQQQPEAAISGIVGDLDTTILFATSGSLRAQDENESYLFHRESVLRCAKALVEDTRPLVASTASDQAQLARAAQESVLTMSQLADTVKKSAASLGPNNSESQVSLIRSVKDVAISLADLIGSTKHALGCDANDPRLMQVKDSARSLVTSVTSLLRTVKTVEDEQQRGCRAIEEAIRSIEQELVNYNSQCSSGAGARLNEPSTSGQQQQQKCSPEEIVRVSRPLTMATAKTVHASSSGQQDDAIVASNMGSKAVADLLQTIWLVSLNVESYELRSRVQEAGKQCALSYKHLIELLHRIFQHPSSASTNPEIKQDLINQSKIITNSITDLVNCSELLKGTHYQQQHQQTTTTTSNNNTIWLQQEEQQQQRQQQPSNYASTMTTTTVNNNLATRGNNFYSDNDDPNDPTVIAESELLGAASSIDAAARKLENLKPRVTSVKLPHEDLNFDEIILEAAKSIIEATASLLRAASASQRELTNDGRLDETETFYASDNNQWSEGLVSAARMVAAATHSLVEAANALVQGQASEERLISAAKQVASSTNQLLVACKVKADPDSKTMNRLSTAGNQIKRATDNLVRAAQQAIEHDEEQSLIISNRKVSGIAQEISAREQILKKEKELQVAKTQLMAIRKAKYANRPDDYQGYGGSLD